MKKLLKIAGILVAILLIVLAGGLLYITTMLPNVGPAPEMEVELTPERVERGKYLANHVMLCMDCHAIRDFTLFSGPPKPGTEGSGGDRFDHSMNFPGVFIAPNITPYNLGDWTDGELFRLITTGVKKDGKPIFPVMPYPSYGQLDEEDIKSVIAYIRTLDPIEVNHPASEPDFPLNLIMNTIPKKANLQPMPSKSDAVAYGGYLVKAAACGDCHTKQVDGKIVGEPFAGGFEFLFPDGRLNRSSNITPHLTGLGSWTQEQFVQRFKMYADTSYIPAVIAPNQFQTVMPWEMYAGMTEEDLEAIYAYLMSLDPVENSVITFVLPES